MTLLAFSLLARLALPVSDSLPVLSFPERGLDDSAVYSSYQTRFFRDAARNTVQIYLDQRDGRVVHLWADADDESLGFTARDAAGRAAPLRWGGDGAVPGMSGRMRTLNHRLVADVPVLSLGWVLLGSMRVERDFQYAGRQRSPFASAPFTLPELERFIAALTALDAPERNRQLALLHAVDVETLRARLRPTMVVRRTPTSWAARFTQPSLDGRDTLVLEFLVDPRLVDATASADSLTLRARAGTSVPFSVRIATTGHALTPLAREEIFTPDFLDFLTRSRATGSASDSAGLRARRLEREVRGVELLSSRQKLMAGLPTYATYFGRDQMVSALMMRSIWRGAMSEAVIASVLRKLGPAGDVSHEEALGGQAIREAASEYAAVAADRAAALGRGDRTLADSLVRRERALLTSLRRVRENYHMIDDEFQLPVLVGRWIDDPSISRERKRAFLLDASDGGGTRAARLLRELALVTRMTAAYVNDPIASNLVSFAPRDSGRWASASWRDSGVGYANGRYAMDVNAIWVPHALESIAHILAALRSLGIPTNMTAASPLVAFARDSVALRRAVATWHGASRHFLVELPPAQVRARVAARLAAMPADERAFWTTRAATTGADTTALAFLALALDSTGTPIGVANTDPATRLFLGAGEGPRRAPDADESAAVLRDVRLFVRPYPAGLLIDRVGPVVANDAYATPDVWEKFVRDPYHGPRVVWGREVNLFLLGVATRVADAEPGLASGSASSAYVAELREAARRVREAAEGSGFHSELWSYGVENGRVGAMRYGTGADIQLWSTTDLAVQFALARLLGR